MGTVSWSSNMSLATMSPTMQDFVVLKEFSTTRHPYKFFDPKPVIWSTPRPGWVKVNIDGASLSPLGLASNAGIFKDSQGVFLGTFSHNIGVANAFRAELMVVDKSLFSLIFLPFCSYINY